MIGKWRIVHAGGYHPEKRDDMSEFPRRISMDKWTPAERAIYDATQVVEQAGAHPLLTDAVILLGKAREKVADYVDGVERP